MADRGLRSQLDGLEATDDELRRYRANLAGRLPGAASRRPWLAAALVAAGIAAVAVGGVVWQARSAHDGFRDRLQAADLAGLHDLARAVTPGELEAARRIATGSSDGRRNATMLLALAEPGEPGVRTAALGLAEDPRPEFRYAYLELLLDRGDEYRYAADAVEEMMDRETDLEVWQLFRELYRIAS